MLGRIIVSAQTHWGEQRVLCDFMVSDIYSALEISLSQLLISAERIINLWQTWSFHDFSRILTMELPSSLCARLIALFMNQANFDLNI